MSIIEIRQSVGERHPCAACGKRTGSVKKCSRCLRTWYCSQACQLAEWPEHKKECKRIEEAPPVRIPRPPAKGEPIPQRTVPNSMLPMGITEVSLLAGIDEERHSQMLNLHDDAEKVAILAWELHALANPKGAPVVSSSQGDAKAGAASPSTAAAAASHALSIKTPPGAAADLPWIPEYARDGCGVLIADTGKDRMLFLPPTAGKSWRYRISSLLQEERIATIRAAPKADSTGRPMARGTHFVVVSPNGMSRIIISDAAHMIGAVSERICTGSEPLYSIPPFKANHALLASDWYAAGDPTPLLPENRLMSRFQALFGHIDDGCGGSFAICGPDCFPGMEGKQDTGFDRSDAELVLAMVHAIVKENKSDEQIKRDSKFRRVFELLIY